MSGFEAWIGNCDIRQTEGDGEYSCQAAVWSDSADTFRARLTAFVEQQGHTLFWVEECHPVNQYLQRHGNPHKIGALARAVHPQNHVELSQLVPAGEDIAASTEAEKYFLFKEHILPPLPDQSRTAPWDREWTTKEQRQLLFGQPNDGTKLKTYAILDSTRLPYLLTGYLEGSGLPYQCLFQGDAAEDLKEQAPYLVELDEEAEFTHELFSDIPPRGLVEKELGVFVRTRANFDALRSHLRKFTMLLDEEGKRYFHNFYANTTCYQLYDFLSTRQSEAATWAWVNQLVPIEAIYCRHPFKDTLVEITPNLEHLSHEDKRGQYRITKEFRAFAKQQREQRNSLELMQKFRAEMPTDTLPSSNEELFLRIYTARHVGRDYGLTDPSLLMKWIMVGVFCAPYFWKDTLSNQYLIGKRSDPNKGFADYFAIFKARNNQNDSNFPLP